MGVRVIRGGTTASLEPRAGEHDTVDPHLILLGFPAEHRMVLENQAAAVWARLVKLVRGDQAGEASADDDQVVGLVDLPGRRDPRLVDPVANAVGGIDDGGPSRWRKL